MIRRVVLVLAGVVGMLALFASPASAAAIIVSRTTVPIGGVVVVSGDTTAPGGTHCAAGDTVTLISNAFLGHVTFAGVGAVTTPVDATGHYRVVVAVRTVVHPGTYTITARCGGGNLGVEATVVVSGLPNTGSSPAPAVALALTMLFVGGAAVAGAGSRRRVLNGW
jgi:hypothetical protein